MNYKEILIRANISNEDILETYMYGSRVYGNFRKNSDWDFIVILKDGKKLSEQFSDNLININFYTATEHLERLNEMEISALECLYLSEQFILKKNSNLYESFKLDLIKLRHSLSAKSSNSWVKAKKKLTVPADYNDIVGKKSLWHSIRIIDFGIQIATKCSIVDYGSCNYFYDEIMFCSDWSELFEKYKLKYNTILTEFRKVAPKE